MARLTSLLTLFWIFGMATAIAHYNYHDCILVNIEANFSVAYMTTSGHKETQALSLQPQLDIRGNCAESAHSAAELIIDYDLDTDSNQGLKTLILQFGNSKGTVVLSALEVDYNTNKFKNHANNASLVNAEYLKGITLGPDSQAYECSQSQNYQLSHNLTMTISYIKIQAYNVVDAKFDKKVTKCSGEMTTSKANTTVHTTATTTHMPNTTSHAPNTTHHHTTPTTSHMPNTTSHAPNTTHHHTTPTTHMPNTTSHAPNTTHHHTTPTTTHMPNTTSHAPNTTHHHTTATTTHMANTTSHAPKTTPRTTVPTTSMPPMPNNTYVVKSGNTTCLVFKAEMELTFKLNVSGKAVEMVVPVPAYHHSSLMVNGVCGNDSETLNILWRDIETDVEVKIIMDFVKEDKNFTLSTVDVLYTLHKYNIHNNSSRSDNSSLFSTALDSYYLCEKGQDIQLQHNVVLTTKNVQLQGFRTGSGTDFTGSVNNCEAPKPKPTSAVVPIAVGAALAAMVVIVLIGYCIGRARSRPGYQQMS